MLNIDVGSDTLGNPICQKLAIILDYKCPEMLCLALPAGCTFFAITFFGDFNFKTTFLLKSGTIFHQTAKLGKTSRDTYNPGLWLILLDL